jgi:hypothetical protein
VRSLQLAAFCLFVSGISAASQSSRVTEAAHMKGPHGLEGWTVDRPLPDSRADQEKFPFSLVIARSGRIVRKIQGDPFVWRWIFWAGGRQIAYESGPLHFGMTCKLIDLATGLELGAQDCYHGVPEDAPAWEKALETVDDHAR